jgi:surface antigen
MIPLLFFSHVSTLKKQLYLVFILLIVIVSLPVVAVFGLGQGTLEVLNSDKITSTNDGLYQGPISKTDLYDYGNCTYWASQLREQAGKPISNMWGNANTWAIRATLDGYNVDHIPAVTAIMQTSAGALGHVAYVTNVDVITGAWTISEMNVKGLDIVDTQTLSASSASNFNFIHDKRSI